MMRCMLKSKIHMATVTQSELEYEGSITIDEELIERANILEYEQVMISNMNNGERFETYVIKGQRGSGEICLNGPTARKGVVGDKIIIFSYSYLNEEEVGVYKPILLYLNKNNEIQRIL